MVRDMRLRFIDFGLKIKVGKEGKEGKVFKVIKVIKDGKQ